VSGLGAIDHVGYLARGLDAAVAQLSALLGLTVTRHFERPEFALERPGAATSEWVARPPAPTMAR
jgi:hypothetical protein